MAEVTLTAHRKRVAMEQEALLEAIRLIEKGMASGELQALRWFIRRDALTGLAAERTAEMEFLDAQERPAEPASFNPRPRPLRLD
jgi:hypothetical protein